MPFASQTLFTISYPPSQTSFYIEKSHLKTLKFPNKLPLKPFTNPLNFHPRKSHFLDPTASLIHTHQRFFAANADFEFDKAVNDHGRSVSAVNFDAFLSILEFLCLASSAIVSICSVVNCTFSWAGKPVFGWLGSRVGAWQWVVLVSGVVVGSVIRRRQWRRICNVEFSRSGDLGRVNLLERVEKLEEDLRSSATIIRVLSRQLEKLGIRFRVTRKALKEPISKTAELAQKNSEATRALAAQEDHLEKELGEIQKVLLAMQDQQQKQLELILAIAKSGKLWESKKEPIQQQSSTNAPNSAVDGVPHLKLSEIEPLARQEKANNEKT